MQFENHQYYNCEIELDTGDKFNVSADWIHNSNLDNWQHWSCDAGFKRLSIDQDFNVYSAVCNNQFLGNLFGNWQPNLAPSPCLRTRCTGCTDDLLIAKRASNKNC